MEDILKNANEFIESAEDSLKKERFNASVSDFFKAITVLCDYLIYQEIKTFPKNHNERFNLLNIHFNEIYKKIIELFKKYRESYNLRLSKEDALNLRQYTHELKNFVITKK